MSPLRRLLALTALVSSAAFAGCAGGNADECSRNSDCDAGYCLDGKCRQDCIDSTKDCPKGYVCSAIGKCEFGGGAGGGAGTAGAAGTSGTSGTAGASGTAGKAGSGTAGSGATSGSGTAGSQTAGSSSTGGTGTAGSDPFGGSGGATAGGAELDPCSGDGDCKSGLLCRPDVKGGPTHCTRTCSSNGQCFGGRRCETVDGAQVCAMGDVGRTCTAADQCLFGCLTSQKYCTTACQTGGDCPNGYACQPVGTPPTKVCAKVEAACDSGTSECIAAAACDMSPNLVVVSCTAACNSAADCPQRAAGLPAWTCDGLCRRPADVKGPLEGGSTPTQYACDGTGQVVNLCNDGQHIDFVAFDIPKPPAVSCSATTTTSGAAGDSCVDSCRYQGGCSAGYACTAVGNVGGARIGLCLLAGGNPVGSACANGTQCQYGYCVNGKCSRDCSADGLCPTGSSCVAAGGPPVEGMAFKRCE